jgi:hypothetical protein
VVDAQLTFRRLRHLHLAVDGALLSALLLAFPRAVLAWQGLHARRVFTRTVPCLFLPPICLERCAGGLEDSRRGVTP